MIRMQNIEKNYAMHGGAMNVLHQITLHIVPHEFVAVIGPSGSGKSTLMHIMGCLDDASSGQYWLDGRDVRQCSERELARLRNQKIGFVFQGFQLLPRLSAWENVALPLVMGGMELRRRRSLACEALERVGLENRLHHRPNQLSGGQQQRVAIARALVTRPQVVLADEPTGNLDHDASEDVLSLLCSLHDQGNTLVLITHDPKVAARAQRCILVQGGCIQ
ncbi:MAG: ABC transporter ATP-binding protein [Clostridia bacterium]